MCYVLCLCVCVRDNFLNHYQASEITCVLHQSAIQVVTFSTHTVISFSLVTPRYSPFYLNTCHTPYIYIFIPLVYSLIYNLNYYEIKKIYFLNSISTC